MTVDAPDTLAEEVVPHRPRESGGRTGPRPRRLLPLVLALAVALALAGAGWTLWQVRDERIAHQREAAAWAAGREAAVAFTSYDHRHIDEDLARVTDRSTGRFREEFSTALGKLTAAIRKAHGVSEGEVVQAGLVRHTEDTAVMIAAVDATVTNNATTGPTTRRYRLQITLTRVDDDWLISDITAVS